MSENVTVTKLKIVIQALLDTARLPDVYERGGSYPYYEGGGYKMAPEKRAAIIEARRLLNEVSNTDSRLD